MEQARRFSFFQWSVCYAAFFMELFLPVYVCREKVKEAKDYVLEAGARDQKIR
ncbi:hypothetical protein BpJC4_18790 [Weizmannia acidilactici]|nr:hypothetical protein BpJC4_18790 [Weizmannia acidilactici]